MCQPQTAAVGGSSHRPWSAGECPKAPLTVTGSGRSNSDKLTLAIGGEMIPLILNERVGPQASETRRLSKKLSAVRLKAENRHVAGQ